MSMMKKSINTGMMKKSINTVGEILGTPLPGPHDELPPPEVSEPEISKPELPKCEVGTLSNSANDLAKLQACRDAVQCYADIINTNNEIITYNDQQDARFSAATTAWQTEKQQFEQTTATAWQRSKASRLNSLHSHRKSGKCTSWPDTAKCRGSNYQKIGEKSCDISTIQEAKCKYTDAYIASQMHQWVTSNPKPVFTKPAPSRAQFPLMQQNETEGIIQCCSNYINVTGDPNDVQQKCLQEIDNLEQTIIDPPTPGPGTSGPGTSGPGTSTTNEEEKISAEESSSLFDEDNMIMYAIIAFIALHSYHIYCVVMQW
jgi:hypothetical protein